MLTLTVLFVVAATVMTLFAAAGVTRMPWWAPVLCLCIVHLLQLFPK